jgi:REP element-mobilizing transposase RayT
MSNHVHLIVNCNEPFLLKDTIRDLKKYTSKAAIQEIINGKESRRQWMLEIFKQEGEKDPKNKTFKVWQKGNHALELYSEKFTWEKINYIHRNPVKAGLVIYPEQWLYSSATNYAEKEDLILKEVICLPQKLSAIG